MAELENKLQNLRKKAPNAARSAINKSVTEVRKVLINHIKQHYTLKGKQVSDAFVRKNASVKNLEASLTIRGEPLELREFLTKYTRSQGVRVKVKRDSPFETFKPKLFWADLPAGGGKHRAVMQRSASGRQYKNPLPRKSKGLDTTYIKKLIGPSIPGMVWGEGGAFDQQEKNLREILNKHIEEAVQNIFDKELEKNSK